ncbi:CxC ATPase DNA modification system associated small protein [Brevundimonas bullata]
MLDKALIEALEDVVREEGQPRAVAQRLAAWLNRLSEAEVGRDENTSLLANVREALVVEGDNAN